MSAGRAIGATVAAAAIAVALRCGHRAEEASVISRAAARDAIGAIHDPDLPADKAWTVAQATPGNEGGAGSD